MRGSSLFVFFSVYFKPKKTDWGLRVERGTQPKRTNIQLSAMDVLVLATMKNAAKCDT